MKYEVPISIALSLSMTYEATAHLHPLENYKTQPHISTAGTTSSQGETVPLEPPLPDDVSASVDFKTPLLPRPIFRPRPAFAVVGPAEEGDKKGGPFRKPPGDRGPAC